MDSVEAPPTIHSTFSVPQIQEIKIEIKGMRWKPWLTNPQEQAVRGESSQNS